MVLNVINFILENPNIILSIAVFLICVIIGFFGDRRFKKNGTLNKITEQENKIEENKEQTNEESIVDNALKEEIFESKIEDVINTVVATQNEIISNDNGIYENKIDIQNDLDFSQSFNENDNYFVNPYENNSMNPLVMENESFNQEIQSGDINASSDLILPSEDDINNMF